MTQLLRLSKLQCTVQKKVAPEYGYKYSYLPKQLMEEINECQQERSGEGLWEYLNSPMFWERFMSCRENGV